MQLMGVMTRKIKFDRAKTKPLAAFDEAIEEKDRKNKASMVMVAGVSVRSLSGSTSVREPTNRTNRGRVDAISSRQTGRHVGKALETAGHGRRGAAGMGWCTRGRSQDRAGEGAGRGVG